MNQRPLTQRHIESTGYLKILQYIFFGTVFFYFGRKLLMPMCFGLLVAIILYPVCKWLEKHKWPRSLAITASLFIIAILFGGLIELLILQINAFRDDAPLLLVKIQPAIHELRVWIHEELGIGFNEQNQWFQSNLRNLSNNTGTILSNTLSITISTLLTFLLVPIYTALFLYNRSTFIRSLEGLVGRRFQKELGQILQESIHTYFNFIKGTIIVYIIVGILNSIGLMALGIKHAVLFGMLTALMTMIPYVGIVVSALLPISVALITKDSIWYPIGVISVFAVVQYLEANLIFPRVVASQLKVSTWATLVAIIAGGLLWGIAGMILFVPFVGILKTISDHIPEWKPLNILLSR